MTELGADIETALGQVSGTRALLQSLPPGITSPFEDETQDAVIDDSLDPSFVLEEYDGIRYLFRVFAKYEVVEEVLSRRPGGT